MSEGWSGSKRLAIVTVVLVLAVAGAPAVLAGDAVSLLLFEPDTIEAAPGDTVEVSLEMRSDGGYGGVGIEAVSVTIGYDPDAVEVVAIERGPWLDGGEETDIIVETTVDESSGNATIEQSREPPAGGTTGTDVLVELTLRIDDGVDEDTALEIVESEVLLTNGYPQPTLERGATIVIGNEAASGDGGDEGDRWDVIGTDGQPGFGTLLAAVASGAGVLWARRRGR